MRLLRQYVDGIKVLFVVMDQNPESEHFCHKIEYSAQTLIGIFSDGIPMQNM